MSEQRATGDTLILPFSSGMLIGGAVTGWICLLLGLGKHLVGMGDMVKDRLHLFGFWSVGVAFSVVIGSLLELGVLKLTSVFVRFPLALRLSSASLVVLGIAAASASTFASCLTIDLGPHPELPFYKGPDPPFPFVILAICTIAPFLFVKRATPSMDEPDSKIVDQDQGAEDGEPTPIRDKEADHKDAD
jgi:hypothetical protein